MRDTLLFAGLVLAFAALLTVHVAIVWSLARQHPRWRAAVAFFVPPLAPYWALRNGMVVRGGIWIGSVILYTTLLGLAAIWIMRSGLFAWLALLATTGPFIAACQGCHNTPRADSASTAPSPGAGPTLRLYAISNLAGALEPCGCTKDQLGGLDHLAAFVAQDRKLAQGSLVVAAGPTMFLDPTLDAARGAQDRWKGEAISESLSDIGLSAWTPGFNDWAGGAPLLATLAKNSHAPLVASNLEGTEASKGVLLEAAGIKVGIAGVSAPEYEGARPPGIDPKDPTAALKIATADLRARGAKILIGLASVPRGLALRLAEAVPDLSVLVVGKPSDGGEANDAPPPPVLVGGVLVIGTSNHLQTIGVVDFFVHGSDYKFQDGTGVANMESLLSITKRIHELEGRLASWEGNPSIRAEDVAARRNDLAKLGDKEKPSREPSPSEER